MKRNKTRAAIVLSLIGFSIIFWILIRGFFYENFISINGPVDLGKTAQFGDFIGGVVGTIFAFVGVLLLYETLSIQKDEFSESRDVFTKQQFDNTFFELLNLYKENVSLFQTTDILGNEIIGKNFFKFQKEFIQTQFIPEKSISKNRKNAVLEFRKVYINYEDYFSTYFRTLYRIYWLIEESHLNMEEKKSYSKIFRAQLSYSELFFIRYNAMTDAGRNSIPFINQYNILKHLSHFELLEFKHWWSKLSKFEKNGLSSIFKEVKITMKTFLKDKSNNSVTRKFKKGKYQLVLMSSAGSNFGISLIKNTKTNPDPNEIDVIDGMDKFNNEDSENLIKCILKELIIHSNFNKFNNRKDLEYYFNKDSNSNYISYTAGFKNTKDEPLKIHYRH